VSSSVLGLATMVAMTFASMPARAAGSLDALAKEASTLGPIVGPGVVVAAPLTSDEPRGAEGLAIHLAALIAAQLGASMTASPRTAELVEARSAAKGASTLVFVRTWIVRGDVRVTAEAYSGAANVWDRIARPPTTPTRQVTATAKIDAQTRAFLTPLTLEGAHVQRFRLDDEQVLAAACADSDDDGRDELLLVSRRRVALGYLREGAFVPERTAAWSDILPRAAIPMREPIGGAVAAAGTLLVGSTDYGGAALSLDLSNPRRLGGIPVWGGHAPYCLMAEPSAGAFDGAPVDCAPSGDPKPALVVPAPRFDGFAATAVIDASGHERLLVTVREPSGRLTLKLGDEAGGLPGPFGAQIAVGDIDQDGFPEVVTTTSGGVNDDAIDVLTLVAAGAAPQNRLHLPTPDRVRALAVCPPGEHGAPALAAVVGREVWLVRAELSTSAKGSPR